MRPDEIAHRKLDYQRRQEAAEERRRVLKLEKLRKAKEAQTRGLLNREQARANQEEKVRSAERRATRAQTATPKAVAFVIQTTEKPLYNRLA